MIKIFFQRTGFDIWENDGPYPGDVCASTTHTKKMVSDMIKWYIDHRLILNADMIQLRRADGRDWDGFIEETGTAPRQRP